MTGQHHTAVMERLRGDAFLESTTFDDEVTGGPERYAVVFSNNGVHDSLTLNRENTRATSTHTIHSVGLTREQAQLVADHVIARMLDWRPVIEGRRSWRTSHESSQPIRTDRDGEAPLWYGVDQFDITSIPA